MMQIFQSSLISSSYHPFDVFCAEWRKTMFLAFIGYHCFSFSPCSVSVSIWCFFLLSLISSMYSCTLFFNFRCMKDSSEGFNNEQEGTVEMCSKDSKDQRKISCPHGLLPSFHPPFKLCLGFCHFVFAAQTENVCVKPIDIESLWNQEIIFIYCTLIH